MRRHLQRLSEVERLPELHLGVVTHIEFGRGSGFDELDLFQVPVIGIGLVPDIQNHPYRSSGTRSIITPSHRLRFALKQRDSRGSDRSQRGCRWDGQACGRGQTGDLLVSKTRSDFFERHDLHSLWWHARRHGLWHSLHVHFVLFQ